MEKFLYNWNEYQRLIERCPFTDEERRVFDLRRKGCSITQIALKMNICERSVNRRIKSIKTKIMREA